MPRRAIPCLLVVLLAPAAARADFRFDFAFAATESVANNVVLDPTTLRPIDLAPDLAAAAGSTVSGSGTIVVPAIVGGFGSLTSLSLATPLLDTSGNNGAFADSLAFRDPADPLAGLFAPVAFDGGIPSTHATMGPGLSPVDLVRLADLDLRAGGGITFILVHPSLRTSDPEFSVTYSFTQFRIVPEPSSLALLGLGLVGLAAWRRPIKLTVS